MNEFEIKIRDINKLGLIDVTAIYSRLSWPDSGSSSSIQKELDKRYLHPKPGPHPSMDIAFIWHNSLLVAWVGTRLWPERHNGEKIMAQTVECFTDPALRGRGYALLGLQALITAGFIDREKPVSVYAENVVRLAERAECKIILLCDP
jgi:hypothetical protein